VLVGAKISIYNAKPKVDTVKYQYHNKIRFFKRETITTHD
jgi:hypothetical protein